MKSQSLSLNSQIRIQNSQMKRIQSSSSQLLPQRLLKNGKKISFTNTGFSQLIKEKRVACIKLSKKECFSKQNEYFKLKEEPQINEELRPSTRFSALNQNKKRDSCESLTIKKSSSCVSICQLKPSQAVSLNKNSCSSQNLDEITPIIPLRRYFSCPSSQNCHFDDKQLSPPKFNQERKKNNIPYQNFKNISIPQSELQLIPCNLNTNSEQMSSQPIKEIKKAKCLGHLLNIFLVSISIFKLKMSFYTLCTQDYSQYDKLFYWIIAMIIYDLSYVLHLILASICLNRCTEDELLYCPSTDNEEGLENISSIFLEQMISKLQPINLIKVQLNAEKKFPKVKYLGEFGRIVYTLIFIFGNIIISTYYNNPLPQNQQFSESLFQTSLLYLIFGYVYQLVPITATMIWPIITMVQFCIEANASSFPTVDPNNLSKLLICKYKDLQNQILNASFSQSCVICQVDYQENDSLLALPCNSFHFFHEDCGKKWLQIKGNCPICREYVDKVLNKSKKERK